MSETKWKLVIVGDPNSGKTALLTVFYRGTFSEEWGGLSLENYLVDVEVDGKHVKLALWDTPGEEDYDRLRPLFYPDSHVILICFSISNPDSLSNVEYKWVPEVARFCPGLPIILVGCKKDGRHDPRVIEELRKTRECPVSSSEGMALTNKIGAKHYFECSARTGEGVREVFQHAVRAARLNHHNRKKHKSHDCVVS